MFEHGWQVWVYFNAFVVAMLALDLGVFHRKAHTVSLREALGWTAFWFVLSLTFALMLALFGQELGLQAHAYDRQGNLTRLSEGRTALDFLTAYLIEQSLSVDNMFVFLIIFRHLGIPPKYQHGVLFWGILGALVMRLSFILIGVALLRNFHWVAYVFGAILLFTGIQLWRGKGAEMEPGSSRILRWTRRILPVTTEFDDRKFFTRRAPAPVAQAGSPAPVTPDLSNTPAPRGRLFATPLFVALILIETTDVIFAVDSVPAVLAITQDSFIAYSSNVFAILGLRALYFALAGVMDLFEDLHYGLAFILVFVGAKMIAGAYFDLPDWTKWASLGVVAGSLVVSIAVSLLRHKNVVEKIAHELEEGEPPSPPRQ